MSAPPLVWVDKNRSASFAATPIFGNDVHGEPSGYKVYCSLWWFHPSFEAPQQAGGWDGDLAPAKAAAEADYLLRVERLYPPK